MASVIGGIQGLLGKVFKKNSTAEQLLMWNVAGQIIGALMAPGVNEIAKLVNSEFQTVQLTPQQLADALIRNVVTRQEAHDVGRQSGVSPSDMDKLALLAGDAPAPEQLIAALRRGILNWDSSNSVGPSVLEGLRQGRLRDEWAGLIRELGFVPIGVADAVDAVVEGQIEYAAGEKIAYENGVRAEDFRVLFNTRGNPPDPSQLAEMVRRGIIPQRGTGPEVTSFQQGIFESAWKDKWEPHFERLIEAVPPPRTVVAMLRAGSIDDARALALFQDAGLSAEIAGAYVAEAHHTRTQAARDLAKADIEALYRDQAIDHATAMDMLSHLHYSAEDAAFLLAIQDFHRNQGLLNQAIGRVRSLYVNHRIARDQAVNALGELQVPPAQRDHLVQTWDLERALSVKVPTEAQVASAFHAEIIDQATAIDMLTAQGFSAWDAWFVLSAHEHRALAGQPPR